ncbi:MAG TPA: type II secretion system protein [Verrucomicrobiae bacterium]|nr:type II secretion system protein [Verrucomicrobiae bacterium]
MKKSSGGFTLTDLLVVLAVITVLGATLLPALAGSRRNSKLAQCLQNLRQICAGSSIYAGDFADWYPVTTVGSFNPVGTVNKLGWVTYARYFAFTTLPDGTVLPRSYLPAWSGKTSSTLSDENLGYLYAGGIVPDGHTFFCPSYDHLPSTSTNYYLSPDYYSAPQFMSTHDSAIRSDYLFNPRVKYATTTQYDNSRKYQKTTDVKSRDVLALDYFGNALGSTGLPFTPDNWAHWPAKGFDAGFTDGSARLATLTPTQFNNVVSALVTAETQLSAAQYNAIYDYLLSNP